MALSTAAWAFFTGDSVALVSALGMIGRSYVKLKAAEVRLKLTADHAAKTVEQTTSTGNGFATAVLSDLQEIKAAVRRNAVALDHVAGTVYDHIDHHPRR